MDVTKTWLLVDSNYLCYRAFHTMGHLSYGGKSTGVIYGFLKEVLTLMDLHCTTDIVFCFDRGCDKREEIYPKYKSSRRERYTNATAPEKEARESLETQIHQLRTSILQKIGFQNVFWQWGFEADDLIATLCNQLVQDQCIIVSSDHDLFQLIGPRVRIWNPHSKKMTSLKTFEREWGISPSQWADVKAIAGCATDDIEGVRGVGEKTAAKFLAGKLKPESSAYNKIVLGNSFWKRNLKLVRLPFPGVLPIELQFDKVTNEKWEAVSRKLGMTSLVGRAPME